MHAAAIVLAAGEGTRMRSDIPKVAHEILGVSLVRYVVDAVRGAGIERVILLVLDNAGWHSEPGLSVPEGLHLVFLPPYTPELQPAETLWTLVDEPIVNKHIPAIEDLENIIATRCVSLASQPETIRAKAGFHWWPKIINPK